MPRITFDQLKPNVSDFSLSLTGVALDEEALTVICQYLDMNPKITFLFLSNCKITDKGAKILGANKTLTYLDLRFNQIGDEGAKAFANNKTLQKLNLSGNRIGDTGAQALARNTTLRELSLNYNAIGDIGAEALAKNKILTKLSASHNRITDTGIKRLQKECPHFQMLGNHVTMTFDQLKPYVSDFSLSLTGIALDEEALTVICQYLDMNPKITCLFFKQMQNHR